MRENVGTSGTNAGGKRPLYVTIAERITGDFRDPAGDVETRLPGEIALAEKYRVSRATVREALRLLERSGATRSRHGVGTFMVDPAKSLTYSADALVGYSSAFRALDARTSTVLLDCTQVDASPEQVERLGWPAGKVVRLERLRVIDVNVVAYSIDNAPVPYLGGAVDKEALISSFFGALEKGGHKPDHATTTLHALVTPPSVAKYMPSCKKKAILLSEETVYDEANRAIAVSSDYLDTSAFNYQVRRSVK